MMSLPEKLVAMQRSLPCKNVTELKIYLRDLNHYKIYLANISMVLEPRHCLLKKEGACSW